MIISAPNENSQKAIMIRTGSQMENKLHENVPQSRHREKRKPALPANMISKIEESQNIDIHGEHTNLNNENMNNNSSTISTSKED